MIKTYITECKHKFYKRVSNLTDIVFDSVELNLLNKGFKYNLPDLTKNHAMREMIHTEAAIKSVPDLKSQNELRVSINNRIGRSLRTNNNNIMSSPNNLKQKYANDIRVLKQINNKIIEQNAIVAKADKGNTLVIMHRDIYYQKVYDFIKNNNIKSIGSDPTQKYMKHLNNAINKCTNLFNEATRRHLKPMIVYAPQFNGLPKIHKPDTPIRPLINYTTAPGYKISKKLVNIIKNNVVLDNNHCIKNSIELVNLTKEMNISSQHKFVSFDITNLYTSCLLYTSRCV